MVASNARSPIGFLPVFRDFPFSFLFFPEHVTGDLLVETEREASFRMFVLEKAERKVDLWK